MAVFQIEDGIATGRGFTDIDANGICSKFKTWVVKNAASGGPGWYIIDDYSTNTIKTFATTDVNTTTETLTITSHGYSHCHEVKFSTTGSAPSGLTNNITYYVIYVDTNTVKLATTFNNAVSGTAINLTSQGSGTHSLSPMEYFIIISDANSATVNSYNGGPGGNAPKYIRFGYHVSNAGYISIHGLLYWDTTLRMGRVYWTGRELATYDAADFVYSFRGGAEQMMIATRTGTIWNYMIIDNFLGDTNLVEAATKVGVLQSGISAGSKVVCQLNTGEGLNFTANNYYFIYDFTTTTTSYNSTQINYVKITSVDIINDTITIETLTNNFNTGAVISPYTHRFYSIGVSRSTLSYSPTSINIDDAYLNANYSRIPYYSSTVTSYCYRQQGGGGSAIEACKADWLSSTISRMAPDDMSRYAAQRPVLVEYTTPGTTNANRAYGIMKNIYASAAGTALAWSDYRTLNTKQWLYIGQNDFHVFTLNTESAS